MKRSALILLTAIYLLSCVGIGVNRFYCCGKLTSVTLTFASADHVNKNNCCKHESKSFKIKDSHVTINATAISQSTPALLPNPANWTVVNMLNEQAIYTSYQANAPPGNPDIPIYAFNCTYRI